LLDELSGVGSSLEQAREEATHLLRRIKQNAQPSSADSEAALCQLCDEDLAHLFFPYRTQVALTQARHLLAQYEPSSLVYQAILRWRDELWDLVQRAEREHLWGSFLILMCYADQHPEFVNVDRH
jgi:hypothetical protein